MIPTEKILVAFATSWGTRFGGINSFNADLMSAVAATYSNKVTATCVVLSADLAETKAAHDEGVRLISLNLSGIKDFPEHLEPKVTETLQTAGIDVRNAEVIWLGHDRITGAIALALAAKHGGRSVLIHHMSYVHYEAFPENSATARKKEAEQKQLFTKADIVLAVGPLLRDALQDMLDGNPVPMLVPGLASINPRPAPKTFKAFLSGRLNDSARKIKQAYLGVAAFGTAIRQCTEQSAFPSPLHQSHGPRLTLRGVDFENLDGSIDPDAERALNRFAEEYAGCVFALHALPFTEERTALFDDLRAASVAMMPSWHEGFGLVAWEAIAAGVPLILSSTSGAFRLLNEHKNGICISLVQVIDVKGSHKEPHFIDEDRNKLAQAIIQVAKDPSAQREKAVQLRDELLKQYTWDHCARELLGAFGWDFDVCPVTKSADSSSTPATTSAIATEVPLTIDLGDVRNSFASTSRVGRSWRRDIATIKLVSPVVKQLMDAIKAGKGAILLTGLPGSGKTCIMLEVQDKLEMLSKQRKDLVPLFIQASEFADDVTVEDRQAKGLPEQWVEKVAILARDAHVVVVIDSLDVLSIAREHTVLTYFLAQIDRLLLIQNVTVVTACRSFDRNYDRRIALRNWDVELSCMPLDWDNDVHPLLSTLGIDTTEIDTVTRELIRNPRELAIFVELARKGGSFNVVTSQSLAQQYLKATVQDDASLGDPAMKSIENMATEMLRTRSLTIRRQRFTGTENVLKTLLSHNVLHVTKDDGLTFDHQTLLDVLVVSGAVRRGVTLHEFIQSLPPVPFVRPSIRSFVAQLALGDRQEFRRQLRTVLTGSAAFHIRRLVAESFADQKPVDEDWQLILDLRTKHSEVFQVIYTQAIRIEWHHFWLKHLVPILKDRRDAEGLVMHVHRTSQWKNEDAAAILAFWAEALTLEWVDATQIVRSLAVALSEIREEHMTLTVPLLENLLNMPQHEHSFLGYAVARCVVAGAANTGMLWRYIAGNISDDDVIAFDFSRKLRCDSHEFGNNNSDKFLSQQMMQSPALLDLAIQALEQWSNLRVLKQGVWMAGRHGFLGRTSYNDVHSQHDVRHVTSERVLLDAIETAILYQAKTNSNWWQINRDRLCFSPEGALRYFAVLACTSRPEANRDHISRMLHEKAYLESDLSFELGTLVNAAFQYLAPDDQASIQATILTIHEKLASDVRYTDWVGRARAKLIAAIPCYLRSPATQTILDEYEKVFGTLILTPEIGSRGGVVSAPFSFEVFLAASDAGILRLLSHYDGYQRRDFDDFLVGGEEQVGQQLRQAASLHPSRFLNLLCEQWTRIPGRFRDDIMSGAANYLAHRYGNLQPSGNWSPIEEPNAQTLARSILDELDRHPFQWRHNRAACSALQGCAYVIADTKTAERLVFLAIGFENFPEGDFIQGDNVDLINNGINMTRGHVVEALMIMANQLHEIGAPFPTLLSPTLRRFAADSHPAIRALILRRLPYFQSHSPELGWELFHIAMQSPTGLWKHAEPCLYNAYHKNFERVKPVLARILREGRDKDLETWGRISALAALTMHINFTEFLEELKVLDSTEAWSGASSVWTHPENLQLHNNQCIKGLEACLNARNAHAQVGAGMMDNLLTGKNPAFLIPTMLLQRYFEVIENDHGNRHHRFFGLDDWLNTTAQRDPMQALAVTELYLAYVKQTRVHVYDFENNLTQLLTRLFANAEEREESDQGEMLRRVVSVQDTLLGLGLNGINNWLKAAERP